MLRVGCRSRPGADSDVSATTSKGRPETAAEESNGAKYRASEASETLRGFELPYQHDMQPAWTVGTEHDRLLDISRT